MAGQKVDKKRKRTRKSRTEVSSSFETSSDSEASSISKEDTRFKRQQKRSLGSSELQDATSPSPLNAPSAEEAEQPSPSPSPRQKEIPAPGTDPASDFKALYLKQATAEFANDLDKLRSAGDFSERSLPVLVRALEQGAALFGVEDWGRAGLLSGGDGSGS